MARKSLRDDVARDIAKDSVGKAAAANPDAEQVTQSQSGDVLEARSTSKRIKTVDDLLKHIEADMSRFEIAASEATKWECGDGDGGSIELHRVFVRLKPKGGPTTREIVQAMIDAARKDIRKPLPKSVKATKRDAPWQVLVIADPHFGKYAWGKTTGGDYYDLDIAARLVGDTGTQLLATGDAHKPARRTIAFVGDLFHYDRPDGSTTSGTPLERDGRLQKMIEVGCDTLLSLVHQSAETVPTDVVIVNGNHDEVLSWTFQRIMQERFRGSKSVVVKPDFTGRQYLTHGRNLLGFAHGHRAKKKLPQIMALEASSQWSECPYREWHTGHFHSQAAEWQRPIETLDGVVVRTAPALCPPDDWHSVNGFIGSRQAMETFLYDPAGGLSSMHVAGVKA
jgi:UDP-2,3-diacylglucosamine pyrophosphatase LpxH